MVNIFTAGEIWIESQAEFEDGTDTAAQMHRPLRRSNRSCDQLQKGALARAILTDDRHRLTGTQGK